MAVVLAVVEGTVVEVVVEVMQTCFKRDLMETFIHPLTTCLQDVVK